MAQNLVPVKPQITKNQGWKLMAMLMLNTCIMWTLFGNIVAFYPLYRYQHHSTISDTKVGIVLATFDFGVLLSSAFVGSYLSKVGRKNFILIGNVGVMLASAAFGIIVYIQNDHAFFCVSVFLRIIQGIGESCTSTACFSIIATEYSDKREMYYGYLESALGLGFLSGPAIGQPLYTFFGFQGTFLATAFVILLLTLLNIIMIPSYINKPSNQNSGGNDVHIPISYGQILKNKRVIMMSLSGVLMMIFLEFNVTILAVQLIQVGVSDNFIGYFFCIGPSVYSLISLFAGSICVYVNKRVICQCSFILSTISLLLLGPSQLLQFPFELYLMIMGAALLGAGPGVMFATIIPEIIEAVLEKDQICENDELNDKASALFTIIYTTGGIIGPVIGGILSDKYRFRNVCDIMAICSLQYALIYFVIIIVPLVMVQRKRLNGQQSAEQRSVEEVQLIVNQ